MNKKMQAAFNQLKKINAPVSKNHDNAESFLISAESNESGYWADYYAEFAEPPAQFNDPYISPIILDILKKYKLDYEWESPGGLSVWND